MKWQDIIFTAVSVVVIVFGVIALLLAGHGSLPNAWFAALLTLLGVIVVASNQVIGISMAGVGIYWLLRDLGLIHVAWLGYGLGIFLIVAGIYGLYVRRRVQRHAEPAQSRTPAK